MRQVEAAEPAQQPGRRRGGRAFRVRDRSLKPLHEEQHLSLCTGVMLPLHRGMDVVGREGRGWSKSW